jgi:hypothetical protein
MKKYYTVMDESNILHSVNRRKGSWIGHTINRNYLLKHVTEREIEVTRT